MKKRSMRSMLILVIILLSMLNIGIAAGQEAEEATAATKQLCAAFYETDWNKLNLIQQGDCIKRFQPIKEAIPKVPLLKRGELRCENIAKIEGMVVDKEDNLLEVKITLNENGGKCFFREEFIELPGNAIVVYRYGEIIVEGKGPEFREWIRQRRIWEEIKSREERFSENPYDNSNTFRLAVLYFEINLPNIATQKLEHILKISDDIIRRAEVDEEIFIARKDKADALSLLRRYDEAIAEYKFLAETGIAEFEEDARLNLALIYSEKSRISYLSERRKSLEDKAEAVKNLEWLKQITLDSEIAGFADRMQKKLKLELLIEYNKIAFEKNDREAGKIAKRLYEELGGDRAFFNTATEIANNYDFDTKVNILEKRFPSHLQGDVEEYKRFLVELARNGKYIGLAREDLEKLREKELDEQAAVTRQGFEEFAAKAKTYEEVEGKKEEIYAKDEILQALVAQRESTKLALDKIEELPEEEQKNYQSLKGQRSAELTLLDSLIAKRKFKLTGEQDPDRLILDMQDIQNQIAELEEKRSRIAKWIPLPFVRNLVEPELNKEILELSEELEEKGRLWKEDMLASENFMQDKLFYNPMAGVYESAGDVDALKTGILPLGETDLALVVAEITAAGKIAGLMTKGLGLGKYVGFVKSTEQGAKLSLPKFLGTTAIQAGTFHTAHNLIRLGLGEDVTMDDWTPSAYGDTFMMFSVLGAAGYGIPKIAGKIPGISARGQPYFIKTAQPISEVAGLTSIQVVDSYFMHGFEIQEDFGDFLVSSSLYNTAFIGGLKIAKFGPGISRPVTTSARIPSIESEMIRLSKETQKIKENPLSFREGRLTKEAETNILQNQRQTQEMQLNWKREFDEQTDRLYFNDEITRREYDLNKKYAESLEKEVLFNQKALEIRSSETFIDRTISQKELAQHFSGLAELKKASLEARQTFFDEQLRQKRISEEDYSAFSKDIDASRKVIEEAESITKQYQKPIAEAEALEKKGFATPTIALKKVIGIELSPAEKYQEARFSYDILKDYTKAEAEFREVITSTFAEQREHHDARVLWANSLFRQGRYEDAIEQYRNFLIEYPESRFAPNMPEIAMHRIVESYKKIGKYDDASRELRAIKTIPEAERKVSDLLIDAEISKVEIAAGRRLTTAERNQFELWLIEESRMKPEEWINTYARIFEEMEIEPEFIKLIKEQKKDAVPQIQRALVQEKIRELIAEARIGEELTYQRKQHSELLFNKVAFDFDIEKVSVEYLEKTIIPEYLGNKDKIVPGFEKFETEEKIKVTYSVPDDFLDRAVIKYGADKANEIIADKYITARENLEHLNYGYLHSLLRHKGEFEDYAGGFDQAIIDTAREANLVIPSREKTKVHIKALDKEGKLFSLAIVTPDDLFVTLYADKPEYTSKEKMGLAMQFVSSVTNEALPSFEETKNRKHVKLFETEDTVLSAVYERLPRGNFYVYLKEIPKQDFLVLEAKGKLGKNNLGRFFDSLNKENIYDFSLLALKTFRLEETRLFAPRAVGAASILEFPNRILLEGRFDDAISRYKGIIVEYEKLNPKKGSLDFEMLEGARSNLKMAEEAKAAGKVPAGIQIIEKVSIPILIGEITKIDPITKKEITSELYKNIVKENADEIFQTRLPKFGILPLPPLLEEILGGEIYGTKATVYFNDYGKFDVAFQTEAEIIHHPHTLGKLVEGEKGKEIDLTLQYPEDVLTRSAGYQLQYNKKKGQIIGIQMDSHITNRQMGLQVPIRENMLKLLNEALLENIDESLLEYLLIVEKPLIEVPSGLNIIP